MQLLILAGVDINENDDNIWTSLCTAIINGHYGACGLLLDHGAYIYDYSLVIAAECGHTHICKLLLKYGVDPYEEDEGGTSLHYAAGAGYYDTCEFLIGIGLMSIIVSLIIYHYIMQQRKDIPMYVSFYRPWIVCKSA